MFEVRRAFALILIFLLIFFWFGLTVANSTAKKTVSETISRKQIDFDVFIGEKRIGSHTFAFETGPNFKKVQSNAFFDYRLFNMSLYTYKHSSEETYDSRDCLLHIKSNTQTKAKLQRSVNQVVSGIRKHNEFWLEQPKKRRINKKCLMTFAYWTQRILDQTSLLNAQTGIEVPIKVNKSKAKKSSVTYLLQAENLNIEISYSKDGDWIALNSVSDKEKTVRYRLAKSNLSLQSL